jgi:hypothetical protein
MSILKNRNIICLHRISSFLFLALICFNQVYQFSHLHHFHKDDSLAFEVSYHPLDIEVEHSSAHHHNEEKSSHPNDSQHKYEKQVDWNITRSQSANNFAFDVQDLFFHTAYLPPVGFEESTSFYQEPSYQKEHYTSSSIIRGPPLFG